MGQPKTIAVFSGKGGVGKTTIAAALGTLAGGTIIDADPQASLAIWGDRRQLPHPVILELALSRVATRLAQINEPVVVDTPGVLAGAAVEALRAVDLIVVPVLFDQLNIDVLQQTLDTTAIAGTKTVLLPNRVHHRTSAASITRELQGYELPVCPIPVRERASYRDCWADGLSAAEVAGAGQQEFVDIWAWIQEVV